jgi:hypothetical protein
MPVLKIISGPDAGRSVQLTPGATVRMGRKPPPHGGAGTVIDLVVDDQKLSRLHCEIAPSEAWWVIRDCGSSNGTFLNGERIAEKTLCPGDMIQAGDVFIEFHGVSPAGQGAGARASAPASTPAAAAAPRRAPSLRRRRSAKPSLSPVPLLVILAVAVGIAAVVVLRSRDAGRQVAGGARGGQDPDSPPDGASPGEVGDPSPGASTKDLAVDPRLGVPAETVAAHIAAGEYREAIAYLDALPAGALDPRPLRRKVLDAASADLRDRVVKADIKAAGGDRAGARADLLTFIERAPGEIGDDAAAALERLDRAGRGPSRSEKKGKEAPPAPAGIQGKAPPDGFTPRVQALAAKWKALSSGTPDRTRLEALATEIGNLAREARQGAVSGASREAIRDLFVKVKTGSLKLEGAPLFAAAGVAWQGNRVTLRYDFTTEVQLGDFEKLSNATSLKRTGNLLFLKGECRLLRGDPFAGTLAVRGKVNGTDRGAPNVTVALFTGARHRLRIDGQEPRSLFIYQGGTSGPDPRDFVAFGLGYRAAVATYGGKPVEKVYVVGRTEPLPMPAHALFFGVRDAPLHSDPRECTWAAPMTGPAGPLTFEIRAAGDELSCRLNDKPPAGAEASAAERWEGGLERTGSVSLLTGPLGAQIFFLEIEGEVRSGWVEEQFHQQTLAAFREFDPG